MKTASNIIKLKSNLDFIVEQKQTCNLYIANDLKKNWNLYFRQGHLIWAVENEHRVRRLYRIVNKYNPNVNCQEINLREEEISSLWDYVFILVLIKRKLITEEKAIKIIYEMIYEILFDCFYAHKKITKIKSIFETSANQVGSILRSSALKHPITYIDIRQIVVIIEAQYDSWVKAGLSNYSPNLAPIVINNRGLKQVVNVDVYNKLSVLINGQNTLRDLSIFTKQNLLVFTRSLMPYIHKNFLELKSIEDKECVYQLLSSRSCGDENRSTRNNFERQSRWPLVVCIDDHPNICQQIGRVLKPSGYRVISVVESFHALNVLLENKPDLIFLDLIMPVVNGYELCSQIRKISVLKTTPIVILTGNDGIIDRVRAKVVGANHFLGKPIDEAEILEIAHKYTRNMTSSPVTLSIL